MVTCIGKLGKIGITTKPSATNQQINSIVSNKNISSKYLYHYLSTIRRWLEQEASATTVSIINNGKFSKGPVKLPSRVEQQQIADKLDELLAQVDILKTRLATIPKILKRFRQSVLAAAVSGKLTEGWSEINGCFNTEFQIEKIIADRQKHLSNKKNPIDHLINGNYSPGSESN
jgi:type I restriction enzyme S subunit